MAKAKTLKEKLLETRIVEREIAGFGTARIRALKCREVFELAKETDPVLGVQKIVAACIVDQDNTPIFANVEAVMDQDWSLIKMLSDAVIEVNGLVKPDVDGKLPQSPASE